MNRARVWKDRETGRWCYDVRSSGLRCTGDMASWAAALSTALAEMAWIHDHVTWPAWAAGKFPQ